MRTRVTMIDPRGGLSRLLVAFVLALALLPAAAQAVQLTVNGATYDVQFFQGPDSFNDNDTAIMASPWWGDSQLARDFANAYDAAVTPNYPFDLNAGPDLLAFAYETFPDGGLNVRYERLTDFGSVATRSTSVLTGVPDLHYAYATPVGVPEIDGGALGQGAVILLAIWLMLWRRVIRPRA